MYPKQFTESELMPFLGILILVAGILSYNYSRGYKQFWSPLTIIAVVYAYYCCLGPYEAVLTGDTYDRLLNMRRFYTSAFWGALVSLVSYVIGFSLHGESKLGRPVPEFSNEVLFEYGKKVFLIGFIFFTISTGGRVASLINPLDAQYVPKTGGSFANYLSLSLNFLIPGVTLLFFYFLITKRKFLWLLIPFLVSAGVFVTIGFRYRLVLLACSCG